MEEKNNGLIVAAKTFFKSVKDFFKKLFKKEEIEDAKESEVIFEEEIKDTKTQEENVTEVDEKAEFFKKYEAFKEDKLDVSELSGSELIKMNSMLEEEMKINKDKLMKALDEFNKKNSETNS